jgi:2-polyprenyl-3-methyl-5-hydroxy-6-metoxy-1,4-benzoquinol methylase
MINKHMIKRLLPQPMLPAGRAGYRGIITIYYTIRLYLLRVSYRRRYGKRFIATIGDNDEMFRYRCMARGIIEHAIFEYLEMSDKDMRTLAQTLADIGYIFRASTNILEFGCGYGRFTRFLAAELGNMRLTVTDIDAEAVEFTKSVFAVNGFRSAAEPSGIGDQGKYDVIIAISVFSHLSLLYWAEWLSKLCDMLNSNGLSIMTSHSVHSNIFEIGEHVRAPVFYFVHDNETGGRLDEHYYGGSFISQSFVEDFLARTSIGKLRRFYPNGHWGIQDTLVIEKQ